MNTLKINNAGCVNYNDMNCRVRTAFKNKYGRLIYLEVSAGHKPHYKQHYIVINHLFHIDNERERRANYSNDFDDLLNNYQTYKREYNQENLKDLLILLGLEVTDLKFTDWDEYTPHPLNSGYKLGNEETAEVLQ